jgi:hypothetical protein
MRRKPVSDLLQPVGTFVQHAAGQTEARQAGISPRPKQATSHKSIVNQQGKRCDTATCARRMSRFDGHSFLQVSLLKDDMIPKLCSSSSSTLLYFNSRH